MSKASRIFVHSVLTAATLGMSELALGFHVPGFSIGAEPRIETGAMYYEYEQSAISRTQLATPTQPGSNFTQEKIKYKDVMPTLGGGLSLSIDKFFIDFSAQKAFNGNDNDSAKVSQYFEQRFQRNGTYFSQDAKYDADFDRNEYSISLNYNIAEQLLVFGGYKWAKTQFNTSSNGTFSAFNFTDFLPLGLLEGTTKSKVNYDFKYNGPFLGVVYDLNIAPLKGTLSFNFATAFLNGNVNIKKRLLYVTIGSETNREQPGAGGGFGTSANFDSKGDSLGLTFAINWTGSTSVKDLSYLLGVSAYRYKFNANKSENPDIEESALNFKVGISYAF